MPTPKLQFFTSAGVPLSGGKLYSYAAGTTTPQATYTDSTGNTPNANPIILDSRGECNCWTGTALYKFVLRDSSNTLVWSVDNVGGVATLAYLATSEGAGSIGFLQSGSGAVLQTMQQKGRQFKDLLDFCSDAKRATILAGTITDVTTEYQAAIDAVCPTYGSGLFAGSVGLPEGAKLKITQTSNCTNSRTAGTKCRDNLHIMGGYGTRIIGETGFGKAIIETTGSQWFTIDRGIILDTTLATANKSTIGIYQGCSAVLQQTQNQWIGCQIYMHDDATACGGLGTVAVWNFGAEECTYDTVYWHADCCCVLTSSNDGNQPGQVTAGSFIVGETYTIKSIGTTDFTLIGAASNTTGITFVATGAGLGTGVAAFTYASYQAPLLTGHSLGVTTFTGECFLVGVAMRSAQLIMQNITSVSAPSIYIAREAGVPGTNIFGVQFLGNVSGSEFGIIMEGFSTVLMNAFLITSRLRLVVGGVNTGYETYPAIALDRRLGSGFIDSEVIVDRQSLNGIAAPGAHILGTYDGSGFGEAYADTSSAYIVNSTVKARALGAANLYIPPNVAQNANSSGNTLLGGEYRPDLGAFCAVLSATASNVTGDSTTWASTSGTWSTTWSATNDAFDVGGNFSSGTYTAKLNGQYEFNVELHCTDLAAGHVDARMFLYHTFYGAGTQGYEIVDCNPQYSVLGSSATGFRLRGSTVMQLAAGDTVTFSLYIGGGAKTIDILAGTNANNYGTRFWGKKIA